MAGRRNMLAVLAVVALAGCGSLKLEMPDFRD